MKTSSTLVFFGMSALTGALVLGSTQGCRGDDGGSIGTGGSTTTHTNSGTTSTSDGNVQATEVTIQQITDATAAGHVGPKTLVVVKGAVAMSTKFLASKSSSGSCLWGVFVSAPGLTTTGPNTGILALSYGTPASAPDGGGTAYCPTIQAGQPAGDSFPDDVGPGDVLDLYGETDSYIPTACSSGDAGPGASMVPGIQLSKVNQVVRTTTKGPVPTPAVLSTSDLATLAAGSDATWLNSWGSVRVQAQNVTVMPYQNNLTDTYGHMFLSNGIEVGDKLYYVGYVRKSDVCYSGPVYPTSSPTFNSITGFIYLDYCNWSIAPSDKCHDLDPASEDCASMYDAGTSDAGADPATVCLH